MKYLKTYKLFEADYFDLSPEERRERASDINEGKMLRPDGEKFLNIVDEMESDLDVIRDMLLEISDLGYHTHVSLTPMTKFAIENPSYIDPTTHTWSKGPEMFIDIKQNKEKQTGYEWGSFYGNIGQHRELVDGVIDRILNYLEERGYKLKFTHDNREGKPSEFEWINNPSSYQMQFSK